LRLFPLSIESRALSHRLRTSSETPAEAACSLSRPKSFEPKAPPMRFSSPPAVYSQQVGSLPGSTRTPSLLGLSQTLEGFILTDLCGSISRRSRSWGFHPPELFLRRTLPGLVARRPLSVFLRRPEGLRPHPQGFLSDRNPYSIREVFIPHRTDALLGFSSLPWLSGVLGSPHLGGSSAPGLFIGALRAGLRCGSSACHSSSPGVSRSRGRRPS